MDKALEAIRSRLLAMSDQFDKLLRLNGGRQQWWDINAEFEIARNVILAELATLEKRDLKPGPNFIETETNA